MEKGKITFIGCGVIGAGLAVNSMLGGHPTVLYDTAGLQTVKDTVKGIFDIFVEGEAYTREQVDAAAKLATYTQDLEVAVRGSIFVQESIIERLDIKQDLYRKVQTIIGDSAVIGSSASNYVTSQLQEGALYPEKIVLGHPFNPSYLLPTIEIVVGKQTPPETVEYAKKVYESMKMVPVVALKETGEFIAQGLNSKVLLGAIQMVAEGIATAEDIDKALMYGPGMRFPFAGQLLTIGLGVKGGGWRALAQKYIGTEAPKEYIMVADQVDVEMANRPKELGNDEASIVKYRDLALIGLRKLQHSL